MNFHCAFPLDKSDRHLPQSVHDATRQALFCFESNQRNIIMYICHTLFSCRIACVALITCAAMSAVTTAEELTESKFQKLHAELQPDNSALWRTIPWKTSVLNAQQIAAEVKKPIFIWAMDGHPLGCT
jgi:hypothetical protein